METLFPTCRIRSTSGAGTQRCRLARRLVRSTFAPVTTASQQQVSSHGATAVSLRAWFWPLLMMALIFFASSHSKIAAPQVGGVDKLGHFVVYGWLGVLWARVGFVARLKPLGAWSAVAIASLYGISDEFHQSFTPGRGVEFADWVADTLGALFAVTLYLRWHSLRRWLEGPWFTRAC